VTAGTAGTGGALGEEDCNVAQGSGGRKPAGKNAGRDKSAPKTTGSPRSTGKQGSARQSVAQARSSKSNARTQLIIGGIAIVLITAVIVLGIVLNRKETAVQSEGYGSSTHSVATAGGGGVVTVSAAPPPTGSTGSTGSTPVAIDVYEDALCPVCAEFERQFGQQINQAVDQGTLKVNYHMLNFLNPNSFSKDYSTRAAAALLCVAQQGGSRPGLYLDYHAALFSPDHQPTEGGTSDLTNQQLADLATAQGAPAAAAQCISSGQNVAAAAASAKSSTATLSGITGGRVATPTVVKDGATVDLTVDWLSKMLGKS
jgi:protein-disulfide isomerase